jgi:hypothetical protein
MPINNPPLFDKSIEKADIGLPFIYIKWESFIIKEVVEYSIT